MDEINAKIEEEILREIDILGGMSEGTEEYARQVEGIAKMYKLEMEYQKGEHERMKADEKDVLEEREFKLKCEQAEAQRKNNTMSQIVAWSAIVIPAVCYSIWIRNGLDFEKTGSFTSLTVRNLVSKASNFFKGR